MENPNHTGNVELHLINENEPYSANEVTPALIIRSTLFYIGYIIATLIHAPLCLIIGPFLPFKPRYRFINLWSRFTIWWLGITCNITYSLHGRENIPDTPGAVIVSKHQSQWETFFLQLIFSPQATVLKRELIWVPLFGWALTLLRPIVINRSNKREALKQIIVQGKQRMQEGCWILIFPEGTRTSLGESSKLSKGAFILASETQFPVIPIAHNSGHCWRPHRFLKYPGHITVEIGKPIESRDISIDTLMTKTRDWLQQRMHLISEVDAINATNITIPSDRE